MIAFNLSSTNNFPSFDDENDLKPADWAFYEQVKNFHDELLYDVKGEKKKVKATEIIISNGF